MNELKFPKKFLWGAASSAHQVEGGNANNDWWQAESSGFLPHRSGQAADHFNLFAQDFELARQLGHNAHRFSIEWSRIEPEQGKFDEAAAIHYRRVILQLREKGLEPVVTLHHFTNPAWFAAMGGWENKKSVKLFARYAKFCAENFGDYVQWWCTINEPGVFVNKGYLQGAWPPFRKNKLVKSWLAMRNIAAAHNRSYKILHKAGGSHKKTMVGIVNNMPAFAPARRHNLADRLLAKSLRYVNEYILRLTVKKSDFIGLNYYSVSRLKFTGTSVAHSAPTGVQRSDLGWEISPQGFLQVLREVHKYRKPILITENGLADNKDDRRWPFILNHLLMVYAALTEGIDVAGYLHWALTDNFEWAEGFEPRFGLVEINYDTQQRKARPSAWQYAQICRSNSIAIESFEEMVARNPDLYPPVIQKMLKKITRIKPDA